IGFGLGAALVALTVSAGVYASAQNTNPNPHPFMGRGMGPGGGAPGRGGPMGPDGPLGMLRMLGPQLNLTDAQKEQIKTIAESHREEWKALGDRERLAHEALTAAIMADTMDEALIRSKSAELGVVQADVAVASARARAAAASAPRSTGATEYRSITRIATPFFFSSSYAFSASNTVTPAPMTVATSSPLSRRTFNPPIVNVSSFE